MNKSGILFSARWAQRRRRKVKPAALTPRAVTQPSNSIEWQNGKGSDAFVCAVRPCVRRTSVRRESAFRPPSAVRPSAQAVGGVYQIDT